MAANQTWDKTILPILNEGVRRVRQSDPKIFEKRNFYLLQGVYPEKSSYIRLYPNPVNSIPSFLYYLSRETSDLSWISADLEWTRPDLDPLLRSRILPAWFLAENSPWEVSFVQGGQTLPDYIPRASIRLTKEVHFAGKKVFEGDLIFSYCDYKASSIEIIEGKEFFQKYLSETFNDLVFLNSLPGEYNPQVYSNFLNYIKLTTIFYLIGKGLEPPFDLGVMVETASYLIREAVQSGDAILDRFDQLLIKTIQGRTKSLKLVAAGLVNLLYGLGEMYGRYKVQLLEHSEEPVFAGAFIRLDTTQDPPIPFTFISAIYAAMSFSPHGVFFPMRDMFIFLYVHEQYHALRKDIVFGDFISRRTFSDDDPALDPENYGEVSREMGSFFGPAQNILADQAFNNFVEQVFLAFLGVNKATANSILRYSFYFRTPCSKRFGEEYLHLAVDPEERFQEFTFQPSRFKDVSPFNRRITFSDLPLDLEEKENLPGSIQRSWIQPLASHALWILENTLRKEGGWLLFRPGKRS